MHNAVIKIYVHHSNDRHHHFLYMIKKFSAILFFVLLTISSLDVMAQRRRSPGEVRDERQEREQRQARPATFPNPPGLPPGAARFGGVEPFSIYTMSVNPSDWCRSTVQVIITTNDKSAYDSYAEELQGTLKSAWGLRVHCPRFATVSRIDLKMLANGEEVRRGVLTRSTKLGQAYDYREEFSAAQSPNPVGENLDTNGLNYQPIIDNIFYGRFDRLRTEDPARAKFSWIYYEFVLQYGQVYPDFLKPDVIHRTITFIEDNIPVSTRKIVLEKRIVDSFDRNENYRTGIFGAKAFADDIEAILQRHNASNSPALALFYENLFRYASDFQSVQAQPNLPNSTSLTAVRTPPVPAGARGARSALSKGVEQYMSSRAYLKLPDDVLANAADAITERFRQIALKPEYQKDFIMKSGEQESFLLWRAQSLKDGDSSMVDKATKDAMERFLNDIFSADPLLFAALDCPFCPEPSRDQAEHPTGFAKRFLKPRANGFGALSDEKLVRPETFEGLRYVPLDMRLKWREELPKNVGGSLLKCEYLPQDNTTGPRTVRYYWYRATPPNWEQISRSLSRNHPLNADVRPPREACDDRFVR